MPDRMRVAGLVTATMVLACSDPPQIVDGDGSGDEGTTSGPVSTTGRGSTGVTSEAATSTGVAGSGSSGRSSTGLDDSEGGTSTTGDGGVSSSGTTGDDPDFDRDGHPASVDCNDMDPDVHPGATERCNGVDDDCDPATPEDGLISIDGEGAWTVIQDAVMAAPAGAELRICPGTYAENVDIDKDLQLVAQQDASVTIIDAGGVGYVASIDAGAVGLTGLTFTGGDYGFSGSGLRIYSQDQITIDDCVITGNASLDFGGGIYGHNGTQIDIVQTTISSNQADFGGGVAFFGDLLTLTDSIVEGNGAVDGGGGIIVWNQGVAELLLTSVIDNVATNGGGIVAGPGDAMVSVLDGVVERNVAGGLGGGAFVIGSGALLGSTNTDWGMGLDDNTPNDVEVFGVGGWPGYGAGATFQCDAAGCL